MPGIQTRISLQVRPGAHRNEVVGLVDGVWRIKIAAPPVEGKANRELVAFLSETLGVSKTAISVISGQAARRKVVAIDGLTAEEITKRLSPSSGDATTRSLFPR